jgi:hypothetical protein
MAFIRKIKKWRSVCLAEVESCRQDGKVRQRELRYIVKEVDGEVVRRVDSASLEVPGVRRHADSMVLHRLAEELGLPELLGKDVVFGKLLQVALAVTNDDGFPIMHKVCEGSNGNARIMRDMPLDARPGGFDTTIVDGGMSSREDIADLADLGCNVVCGVSKDARLAREFIAPIARDEIFHPSCRVKLKGTAVHVKSFAWTDAEAVAEYFGRDIVEKAYRHLKDSAGLHPARKYRLGRVKAHVRACCLAHAILSLMRRKLLPSGISATAE